MKLNERQREAVEYLEGPLLVLAGPGTGKTQLLSQKVAYILRETDTNPENILCLTFTETGAANMRERLKSLIGKAGTRVQIGTYHAFGQDILAQYKNYAEDYRRAVESSVDEIAQFKIVREIRDNLPATDILRSDNVKNIISVISDAKAAGFSADDLARVAAKNIEDAEVLGTAVAGILGELPARAKYPESLEAVYEPIFEILEDYMDLPPIFEKVERLIAPMARDLEAAILAARDTEKISPVSKWKESYFEKDEQGKFRFKGRVANLKLKSIAEVMRKYQEYLEAAGLLDFDDMIQEAIRALKDDLGFRLTLQERYQYIMLDEFQDTNPSQFAIVKYLTDYEKPVVMAVGDDDQAIYEFQGALATNLRDFQEHYGAKVVALEENYRSTQEILDFSTAVIQQADDRFEPNKKLFAKNPKYADLSESFVQRREFLSSDGEFGYVAAEIARLVRAGVPQREIAVISAKRKYFEPLLAFLKEYPEVKIAYEKRDNLLEDERIRQILAILRLVDDIVEGRNLVPVFEVLSCDFFELGLVEVVKLTGEAREKHRSILEVLEGSESVKVRELYEFLDKIVRAAKTSLFESVLWEIVVMMRRKIDSLPEYEQFRFYENLAALKGRIARHFGARTVYLKDFLEMIRDFEESETMLAATSPYRDADDAVQILTAHKAKGLEFEYVFMISVDDRAWGKGKGNNNMLALPRNLMQIRHTGTTDGEKLRVFYVAATRAKTHLLMTSALYDFEGKSPKRLEYLDEAVREGETGKDEVFSPFLPGGKVILDYDGGAVQNSAEQGSLMNLKSWVTPYIENPELRPIYLERMAGYKMSATGLTSYLDVRFGGPKAFFEQNVLGVPREPASDSQIFGNLIHAVFEAVTNRGISDEEAVELFFELLEEQVRDVKLKEDLALQGPASLKASLAEFGEILRQGRAEVDLNREGVSIEGVPMIGRLDHIVVDEAAKTIEIYDFKTSKYDARGWDKTQSLYKNRLQLGFYKLLLNHSAAYKRYTVTRGHILFVDPDKDGRVHDKVYEFNEEDEKELINLIAVVYRQMTTLSFIDDPELFRSPNRQRMEMRDLKEFIEVVLAK